jgi:hypothetical protein
LDLILIETVKKWTEGKLKHKKKFVDSLSAKMKEKQGLFVTSFMAIAGSQLFTSGFLYKIQVTFKSALYSRM